MCVIWGGSNLQKVIQIDICLADLFHIVCMNYLAVYFLTILLIFDFPYESLPVYEKDVNDDRCAEHVDCSTQQDYLTYPDYKTSHTVFTIYPVTSSAVTNCLTDLCFVCRRKRQQSLIKRLLF